jgi:hypothetical protein
MANEEQILELLRENQRLLEATYRSAEKTRKYFLWTGIITVLAFVLPLLGLLLYLPTFLNTFTQTLGDSSSLLM